MPEFIQYSREGNGAREVRGAKSMGYDDAFHQADVSFDYNERRQLLNYDDQHNFCGVVRNRFCSKACWCWRGIDDAKHDHAVCPYGHELCTGNSRPAGLRTEIAKTNRSLS